MSDQTDAIRDLFRDAPGSIGIDMADLSAMRFHRPQPCPDGKHAGVCVAFFITLEGLTKCGPDAEGAFLQAFGLDSE